MVFITFLKVIRHPFESRIPVIAINQRNARLTANQNDSCFVEQFSHAFVPYFVLVWNSLPNEVMNSSNIDIFKSKLNKFFIQNLKFCVFFLSIISSFPVDSYLH